MEDHILHPKGLRRKSERLSPSESVGDSRMTWRMSRTMRMKLRDVGGPEDVFYSNRGTGKIHVGSYTMRTGVQEQTLKQSTYQILRSFTTCACAIFMGQRNNNKNEPCGSWALSQWLTEQRGREGRRQNESAGGPKDNGTESERSVERSTWGCAGM